MLHAIAKRIGRIGVPLVLGVCAVGCSDTPSTEQCEKLLGHVVELQLVEAGQGKELPPAMKEAVKGQKNEVTAYVRDSFMVQCMKLPATFADCALAAKTTAEYADCARQ
jgi:hypothetical protein